MGEGFSQFFTKDCNQGYDSFCKTLVSTLQPYKTYKENGHQVPVDPPSEFSPLESFTRQTLEAPPKSLEMKHRYYESRLKTTQQQEHRMPQ